MLMIAARSRAIFYSQVLRVLVNCLLHMGMSHGLLHLMMREQGSKDSAGCGHFSFEGYCKGNLTDLRS
jgi:hypothetical protein